MRVFSLERLLVTYKVACWLHGFLRVKLEEGEGREPEKGTIEVGGCREERDIFEGASIAV